jgi:hypothetical protein
VDPADVISIFDIKNSLIKGGRSLGYVLTHLVYSSQLFETAILRSAELKANQNFKDQKNSKMLINTIKF